jgi:ElaB/YqjD/DUF883 family membrane-anchored ribosome-binding protein
MDEKQQTEAEIARTTAALVDKAHLLEQRVEQRVNEAKQRVEHMVSPREQLRERPWRTVGIAFGLGFVVGWLS